MTPLAPRIPSTLHFLAPGEASYRGLPERKLRWLAERQLKDRNAWTHFVEAYVEHPDSDDAGWRGEYWGKMMRGACIAQAYLDDPELLAVLTEAVEGLLAAQEEDGRLSSYSRETELMGWDMWSRKYVLTGLQHFYDICPDAALRGRILSAMCRHADCILAKVGPGPEKRSVFETSQNWKGVNSCSILEPFVRLYTMTGETRYLDFARYLVDCGGCSEKNLIDLALDGRRKPSEYPEYKAYETMSYFEGVLAFYEATGERRALDAVLAFADAVARHEITVIGCAGCTLEIFDNAAVRQTDAGNGIMQETCVTVTWMRFCARLYTLTGDARWADCVETAAFNALYGATNESNELIWSMELRVWMKNLPIDSYSPVSGGRRGRGVGGFKVYPDGYYYGCCVCIAAAGFALVPRLAVTRRDDGFALSGLFDGTVRTKTPAGRDVEIEISGGYPLGGEVRVKVSPAAPERFAVAVRVPSFAEGAELVADGETVAVRPGFHRVEREWRAGSEIVLRLPMRVETLRLNGRCAYRRGPIVLAECADGPADAWMLTETVRDDSGAERALCDYASCGKRWRRDDAGVRVWL